MPSWEQVLERRGETVVGGGTWRQRPRYRTIRHGRQGGDLIVDTRPRPPPLIRCFHLETNSRENTAAWMPAADLVANPLNVEFLCSLSSFRASSSSDRSLTFLANFDDSDKARTTTYIPIPNTKCNIKCSRLMLRQCRSAWLA